MPLEQILAWICSEYGQSKQLARVYQSHFCVYASALSISFSEGTG